MRTEILISDFSKCEPKSAFARKYALGKWKLLPYEGDGFKGRMLAAIGPRAPRPVRLPLKLRGWHDIYVALYRTASPTQIKVRLSSDFAYRKFQATAADLKKFYAYVEECYWKAADLTGQSIHIAGYKQMDLLSDHFVAYFRFVPLSDANVRALQRERARTDTKRLYPMSDGSSFPLYSYGLATKRELAEEVEVYKHSDVRGVIWEFIAGDKPGFPVPGIPMQRFARGAVHGYPGWEQCQRIQELWDRTGFDYLRVMRELTHKAGLELFVSQRMSMTMQAPNEDLIPEPFIQGKYDDYCRHADGKPCARLSYARKSVQDRVIRIYRAAAKYGIDGIHLITIRGGPMVMYEKEMLDRFREHYGSRIDPRKFPLHDERVWRVRAELFGNYLRRLRQAVHESALEAGHKPPLISIHGLATRSAMRTFGLDFKSWAREGLIDRIVASQWGPEFGTEKCKWPNFDADFYLECVKGTKTELIAEVWRPRPGKDIGEYYRKWAGKWYKRGLNHLTFWDCDSRHMNARHHDVLSVLGHKDDLQKQIAAASKRHREVNLKTVLDVELSKNRFPSWLCG